MGLKNYFKKQLSTVIEWSNQSSDVLFYKYPSQTDEIKNASKLIVSPGQGCVVVYEGKIESILTEPGTYNLSTDNHPFVTTLLKLRQFFESEHKMSLYYFRTAEIVNQKWGTPTPIKYMDPHYNLPIELGAYGNYSFKIADLNHLYTGIIGSKDVFKTSDMRSMITSRISSDLVSYLAQAKLSYLMIDSHLVEISDALKEIMDATFLDLGVHITNFRIEATSFDAKTQERIGLVADKTAEALAASEVGLDYVQLEKLKALRDAAKNEGGLAGAGLQIGAGLELGKTFVSQKDNTTVQSSMDDAVSQLQKLKMLLDEKILTQEEFDQKKKDILNKL